jgi:hypothetical protein
MKTSANRTTTRKKSTPKDLSAKRAGDVRGGAEAYCVRDKKKVEIQNAQQITMKPK